MALDFGKGRRPMGTAHNNPLRVGGIYQVRRRVNLMPATFKRRITLDEGSWSLVTEIVGDSTTGEVEIWILNGEQVLRLDQNAFIRNHKLEPGS